MQKARKFADAVKAPAQYEFIKQDELSQVERFTIIGARLMHTGYGDQWYFDVAFKDAESKVQRRCISLNANADRDSVAQAVKENGVLVGCRLDFIPTRFANRYAKIVDADTDRVESPENEPAQDFIPGLTDDDIPF